MAGLGRTGYLLAQRAAQELDAELMSSPGFSIDQLMELAGLAVACAVATVWPTASRVLVLCGPGNNGGDALVASRHLAHFGFQPTIVYPKPPKATGTGPLYTNLLAQCRDLDIPVLAEEPADFGPGSFDVLLDGLFGFSFNPAGGVRAPFDSILDKLVKSEVPVASIDVPSGWDVEAAAASKEGEETAELWQPAMLISLTAPKHCALAFRGEHHLLGGRFLPPKLAQKYNLTGLPAYPGTDQITRLPVPLPAPAAGAEDADCKM